MTNHPDTGAPASRVYHQGQWRPVTAELLRTILTEPGGPPAVGGYDARRWASAATASERGQQHVRVALGFVGEAPDLDSPELFDRVAETIPHIAADLHALAHRLGLDPEHLGLSLPAAAVGPTGPHGSTRRDGRTSDPIPADGDSLPAEFAAPAADEPNSTNNDEDKDR